MRILLILIAVAPISAVFANGYSLSSDIHNGKTAPFLRHSGPTMFNSYLSMNLPFEPMAELFRQLLVNEKRPLTSRGEAHITVVTPIEYWNALRPHGITIQEIDAIALSADIQASTFRIVCLGKGEATIDNKQQATFYVVVESQDLLELRKAVQKLLVAKGGDPSSFEPEHYHPHITLGFTEDDLHESNGVIKNRDSCIASIAVWP